MQTAAAKQTVEKIQKEGVRNAQAERDEEAKRRVHFGPPTIPRPASPQMEDPETESDEETSLLAAPKPKDDARAFEKRKKLKLPTKPNVVKAHTVPAPYEKKRPWAFAADQRAKRFRQQNGFGRFLVTPNIVHLVTLLITTTLGGNTIKKIKKMIWTGFAE